MALMPPPPPPKLSLSGPCRLAPLQLPRTKLSLSKAVIIIPRRIRVHDSFERRAFHVGEGERARAVEIARTPYRPGPAPRYHVIERRLPLNCQGRPEPGVRECASNARTYRKINWAPCNQLSEDIFASNESKLSPIVCPCKCFGHPFNSPS